MESQSMPPMPPKVAAAISAVMNEVPKLGKGEKNSHGGYNFASIDDFLEAVRPLCAKHGLIILQDEDSFETKEGAGKDGKAKLWLVIRFSYTLAHISGETWGHRPVRTVMVDGSMGSQAFGAAQSYALKNFERALFQIATGDKEDADNNPADNLPPIDKATKAVRKPPAEKEAWKANAEAIKTAIDCAKDEDALNEVFATDAKALEDIRAHSETAWKFLIDRAYTRFPKEAA